MRGIRGPAAPHSGVRRHVLLYGLLGGGLIALLKAVEYRWLIVDRSVEVFAGLIAATFAGVGIWLGRRLTRPKEKIVVREVPVPVPVPVPAPAEFAPDEQKRAELGITDRELEILQLIARGLSNREIAETVFVSENTVKTHSSRIFQKLGARRRTQAVRLGKQLRLIP